MNRIVVLGLLIGFVCAQQGTVDRNVSSASVQMTYGGVWRSQNDTIPNLNSSVYIAYSNASDASVTFSFLGVGATYLAVKKYDRGLSLLTLDNELAYTVDCYNDAQVPQPEQVLWESPTLPYGRHNVTLSQIGPDSRLGFYPYLYTETWIETVPTDVASYVATQMTTTATNGAFPTIPAYQGDSTGTNIPAIAGGVVGGVIVCVLLGFLYYIYRRDKRKGLVGKDPLKRQYPKPIKSDEKMNMDDDETGGSPSSEQINMGNGGSWYMQQTPFGPQFVLLPAETQRAASVAASRSQNFDNDYYYHQQQQQQQGWTMPGTFSPPPPPRQTMSNNGSDAGHRFEAALFDYSTDPNPSFSSMPSQRQLRNIDTSASVPASRSPIVQRGTDYSSSGTYPSTLSSSDPSSARSPRSYPYVHQGFGSERRTYPVPEI